MSLINYLKRMIKNVGQKNMLKEATYYSGYCLTTAIFETQFGISVIKKEGCLLQYGNVKLSL
jgi:hypothetical protein